MQVFHGSYTEIESVDLSLCQANKDFGRGFYVTKFRKQAEEWAEIIGKVNGTIGVVTEFTFYERAFTEGSLKVLRFSGYNDEWFDFIVLNRDLETSEQKHNYDIIEGPVADDKVQRRINKFLEGEITREVFFEQLTKYPELSHQICFCTVNSLRMLKKLNHKPIIKIEDIAEQIVEKLVTDFGFDEETAADKFFSSNTFSKLSDISTQFYEKDWSEIYKYFLNEL
ncbi:MAG: DUF3990 domain-containing protein [Lentimicrobiaceae bacterium]|nr:DUF3990 domain-containing protein [Lentimicrobiaceae bacterium]